MERNLLIKQYPALDSEAEVEEKKRTDEIQMAQIAADRARARCQAKIGADNELAFKELELLVQAQVNTDATSNPTLHVNIETKLPKLQAFMDKKDQLDSYLLRFKRYAENAKWEKVTWAIKLSALLSLGSHGCIH